MKEAKTGTKKRGLYYILLFVSVLLLAAATVLTVYFATGDHAGDIAVTPPDGEQIPDVPDAPDGGGASAEPDGPDEPAGTKVSYICPVEAQGYAVEHGAVYANATTGFYYRHLGVDFAAAAGAQVYAVADGTVTSVSLSPELGNLVTVDHGGGLVSVYRFIEPAEGLKEGDSVAQGALLGTVAEAYGSEAGAGTHLHFEMTLGGEQTDPAAYLEEVFAEK